MGFLGINLNRESNLGDIKKQYSQIQKKLSQIEKFRPESRERYRDVLSAQDNVLIPIYPFEEATLNDLALHSDALRIALNALSNRIFRRGFKIISKSENSDIIQEAQLNQLLKKINKNNQSVKLLSEQFEWDLDVQDNAYLIAVKDYFFINGKIINELTKTKEIIRASPTKMRLISDYQGNLGITPEGNKLYCSPDNRSTIYTEEQAKNLGFHDKVTGSELRQVFYRAERQLGQFYYYYNDEVFFTSKYNPSLIYGYSNIFSVWMKILTLIYMDRFLMNAYRRGRPPRGLLTIGTTNYASLKKAWEDLKARAREDPHSIEPLAYEVGNNKGGSVNWIDLMKPLTEMQYIESRNEFRRSIMAVYGIMPLFAGDVTSSGGLNSEGEQITVSDIAVEKGQKIFNDSVYPWILSQFGITDWELVLEEPEEQDELEDTKVLATKIDNAQKMAQMGFEVTYYPKEKDFDFSEKPTQQPQMQGFGQGQGFGFNQPQQQQFNQSDFIDLSKELKKERAPLGQGKEPPEGKKVITGPRGGRYYESGSVSQDKPEEKVKASELPIFQKETNKEDEEKFNEIFEQQYGFKGKKRYVKPDDFLNETYNQLKRDVEGFGAQFPSFEDYEKSLSPSKIKTITSLIKRKEKIAFPFLQYNKNNEVVLHEGRHTSRVMKRLGFKLMPLLIGEEIEKSDKNPIKKLYNFEKSLIGENFNKFINKDLEDILIERITKQIWDGTFEGMTLALSNKVKKVLIDGIVDNLSLNEVTKRMQSLGVEKIQAETIVRTESTRIQNTARENMFKELGVEKVFWQITNDSRVSDLCREVHEKTKHGVTMSELKRIGHEVAKKHGSKPNGWVFHVNERSSLGIL